MKRVILCVLALLLLSCGCAQTQEDPFRVDTVVLIPADPTEAPTEAPTEIPTENSTEVPTQPEETTPPKTATSYKSSGSKTSSSGKNQSSAPQKPQETKPAAPEAVVPVLPPALSPGEPPYNPSTYKVGELEQGLLQELNRYRLDVQVGELTMNERLSGIAYLRAQEASVLWSHTRPDGRGYTSALTDYGFENEITAELMIQGSVDFDAAYYAAKWMGYKTSHKDICSADYTTAGIGVYSQEGITYVVCLLIG